MEKVRRIAREEFLISQHNISLKAKVAAEVELSFLKKQSIIKVDMSRVSGDLQERSVAMADLREMIDKEETYLEVIEELIKNGEEK